MAGFGVSLHRIIFSRFLLGLLISSYMLLGTKNRTAGWFAAHQAFVKSGLLGGHASSVVERWPVYIVFYTT